MKPVNDSEWIPISELKPNTADHVIVTLKWGDDDYEVTELDYGVDVACGGKFAKHVLAWMPMPNPYKEEQDVQETLLEMELKKKEDSHG